MMTSSSQENVDEKDIWVRLAKDNLAAWMLNWMPSTALEVIGANIVGAASTVHKALNEAKFAILPDQLKDVPDLAKYTLVSYEGVRITYKELFDPRTLQRVVEDLAGILHNLYVTGQVVQGSVRGVFSPPQVSLSNLNIYYIRKEQD